MKLEKIITKNFKTLLRSKSSALVLILGPLILISLVGLAFNNTSSFNVNVGYHTEFANPLVDQYMANIDTSTYTLTQFYNLEECINNIKMTTLHACIAFPSDFELKNGKTNEIKFYVDKTKVNLVYSIIDTISKGFSKTSANLSLELTNDILSVVTQNKQGMLDAQEDLDNLIEENNDIIKDSETLIRSLNTIVIDTKEASSGANDLDHYSGELEDGIRDQRDLSKNLNLKYEQLFGIISTHDNQTIYDNTETIIDDKLYSHPLEGSIFVNWNETDSARKLLVETTQNLTAGVSGLLEQVENAKKSQSDVSKELNTKINPAIKDNTQLANDIKADLGGLMYLIDNIAISDAENIVKPITTKIETVSSESSHLSSLFPSLIILLIMFISILISANLVLMEKNSKAYFRNFATPVNDSLFIFSTYLTGILMVSFQLIIILGISAVAFNAGILQNLGLITALIIISSTLFIFIGMAIGYVFNTQETAMIGAISTSSLFLLLSDLILPLESMPRYLLKVAQFNPFVLGSETLKQVMLFNVPYESIKGDIWIMIAFSVIILILMVALQQLMKFMYLSSFSRKKVKISKKTNVKDYFKINDNPVSDLEGLIKVIRHMSEKDFKKHISKRNNIINKWIVDVLKNVDLAEKIKDKKKKEDIIFILKRAITQENTASAPVVEPTKTKKD